MFKTTYVQYQSLRLHAVNLAGYFEKQGFLGNWGFMHFRNQVTGNLCTFSRWVIWFVLYIVLVLEVWFTDFNSVVTQQAVSWLFFCYDICVGRADHRHAYLRCESDMQTRRKLCEINRYILKSDLFSRLRCTLVWLQPLLSTERVASVCSLCPAYVFL